MNFFVGIGKRRTVEKLRSGGPDLDIWNRAAVYAEHLALPVPEGEVQVIAAGEKTYASCLLFGTDGTEESCMNAGYLAGQSASYLRFLGMETKIVKVMPEGVADRAPEDMNFIAALVAEEDGLRERGRRKKAPSELSCIYTETRENWSDELLTFAKARYPKTFRRIRASRKESGIHFVMKRSGRRHAAEEAFEAGLAAANIMTAAEELWVDLEMTRVSASSADGYLFSVRRKGERQISYA